MYAWVYRNRKINRIMKNAGEKLIINIPNAHSRFTIFSLNSRIGRRLASPGVLS